MSTVKRREPMEILLMDGGLGTTLADDYQCVFDDSTPLWSSQLLLSDHGQKTLRACQEDFVRSGADVVLTATYQLNPDLVGTDSDGVVRMRDAVRIARDVFTKQRRKGKVVLGLGAYGAIMKPSQEYSGEYGDTSTVAALQQFHKTRLGYFLPSIQAGGKESAPSKDPSECWDDIDMIAFETLPKLEEIIAVREVMADTNDHISNSINSSPDRIKPFWISCVYPGDDMCLPDRSTIPDVINAMLTPREGASTPIGIGINCTKVGKLETLIELYEAAILHMMEKGEVKTWPILVVYPDGTNGEVYNTTTRKWEKGLTDGESSQSWDVRVFDIVDKTRSRGKWKAIYVGGCCKVAPSDIGKLRERLDHAKPLVESG